MKRVFLIVLFSLFLRTTTVFGQDLTPSEVPSLVVNSFQQAYPKAYDVEWELEGDLYKVEFEIGLLGADHHAWYDPTGNLVRHKEEISSGNLPLKVSDKIKRDYSGYRIDEVKKITAGSKVTYTVELKTFKEEWKVVFDPDGNVLSKVTD